MDHDARQRFGSYLAAMDQATSHQAVWDLRRQAEMVARESGGSFDKALREYRSGWPAVDEDTEGDASEPASADVEAEADERHLSTVVAEPTAAISAALTADPSRSDRDIAREAGCSPTTVGRARAAAGLTRLVRTVRRGGQSYALSAPGRRAAPATADRAPPAKADPD